MSQVLSLNRPLQNRLTKNTKNKISRYAILYVTGLIFLTIASKINLPLQPVPVTLQTFAVLFLGMVYGPRLSAVTVISFMMLGLCGMPILASLITTPFTIGYLVGFVPAAFITGLLVQYGWGRSIITTSLAALIGTIVIFFCGVTWLSFFVGLKAAISLGLIPFIFIEFIKIIVLSVIVPTFWKA